MEKKDIIGFQLIGLETSEFAVLDPDYTELKKIKINTGLQFGINDNENLIVCHVIVEFRSESSDTVLKLKTDNHFKVKKDDWSKFKSKNRIVLPKGFLAHLATISTGSARGILHCKIENTAFNQIILPLVNVASMIPEDEIIEF